MLSCPRCHHLNAPTEQFCELCGAELPRSGQLSAVGEPTADAVAMSDTPGDALVSPPPMAAAPGDSAPEESAGLTAALLDALEQDNKEGRARGEGPRARSYLLRPLPVPDDMPAPALAAANVPLAARVKASKPTPSPSSISKPPSRSTIPPGSPPPSTTGGAASRPPGESASQGAVAGPRVICPYCNTSNPPNNRFCGGCGARLPLESEAPATPARATLKPDGPAKGTRTALRVTLICINEDGSDGARIPLQQQDTIIGRASDPRFANDAFLSPRHARVFAESETLFIEDINSLNGTFVRIRDGVKLQPGDCFLMGRQVLRLELFGHQINPKARAADGTRYMGSPIPTGRYKLLQIGIGAWCKTSTACPLMALSWVANAVTSSSPATSSCRLNTLSSPPMRTVTWRYPT
jgi:hypothetical protein